MVQPSIRHFVIERDLTSVNHLFKLSKQFSHVQYLELGFDVYELSFIQPLNFSHCL